MSSATERDAAFVHSDAFQLGELSGNLQLDAYEEIYQKLFAEAIEDGVITPEERQRLEKAAGSLGLDPGRLDQLERALSVAYEASHGHKITHAADHDGALGAPVDAAAGGVALADAMTLRTRIGELENLVMRLEAELEQARAQRDIEVDLSGLDDPAADLALEDPATLHRRVRHDPRDPVTLRALYRSYGQHGDLDGQWRTAQVLVFLGAADAEERGLHAKYRDRALIRPAHSLSATAWQRYLFHPEDEPLTGQIFATIASAVLLGRVAALRRTKALPQLDPRHLQDPATSTIQAVRCLGWAASIVGMALPPVYADPTHDGLLTMVPGVPPATRIGRLALSGRSPSELAFAAGCHLASLREERFVRQLFPDILELQDLFVAGLIIANPALPIEAETKSRVEPVSRAIEPLLQPPQIHRLRTLFARFVEEGGRTNLQRWVRATDATSLRAGLLLCDDLDMAQSMLRATSTDVPNAAIDDLIGFCTGERYGALRAELGIAKSDLS